MPVPHPDLTVRFAKTKQDIRAAQRLRYQVFVVEAGGDGAGIDHDARIEQDRFDLNCDHMLLIDRARGGDQVVGVYRLLTQEGADRVGQFYSSDEFDLSPLLSTGRRLLELGRTCLHPDYRGGTAMFTLWSALARYVEEKQVEILFGSASFNGTNADDLALPLSFLHHNHLAPEPLRVTAIGDAGLAMNCLPPEALDRRAAMMATPALIKGYLRLGGCVGQGAFVDHAFNTTDICMVLDTTHPSARQAMYRTSGAAI